MNSPYERDGKWWVRLSGQEWGPYDTEEFALEVLEVYHNALDSCATGRCEE